MNSMGEQEPSLRLNKFLALQLGISRREADNLISSSRITIDGQQAELGARFKDGANILLDGKNISNKKKEYTYILLNKPTGYVCSRKKQGDNETIYSLLPKEFNELKPVGRLDKDSSGILLLTNDGDFAFQMTHPKFYKNKEYIVELDIALAPLHQQMIADFGINLEDGKSQLGLIRLDDNRKKWRVIMREGRNRQIRRTFAALGYKVEKLHREIFGSYQLEADLKKGEYKITVKK